MSTVDHRPPDAHPADQPTGPTGLAALLQRADGWSESVRAWMVTITVFCCVGIFVATWAVYAGTHVNLRYYQAEPGAAVTQDDVTYRVHGLRSTEVIIDGDEQVPASANTTWIVVDLDLTIPRKLETIGCSSIPLVAVGDRTWESETFYSRDIASWCDPEDVVPRKPFTFQLIYEVPLTYLDQVYGVAIEDHASAAPTPVLSPPRVRS